MILGVDLDNTLICYDGLFYKAALACGLRGLLPDSAPHTKEGVRRCLCQAGREADFTRLQGHVYGPGLEEARPYPGAREALAALLALGAKLYIVSHKTRAPILGPAFDLRQAALDWLGAQRFLSPDLLKPDLIFLEDSKEAKARRVASLGCTHFVDDLPDFFRLPAFPAATQALLFDPDGQKADEKLPREKGLLRFGSWSAIAEHCAACLSRRPG